MSQNLCGSYISSILISDTRDHLPTVCVLNSLITTKREPMVAKSRDTRLRNISALKRHLLDHDWTKDLNDSSPSTNMEKIHSTLSTFIDHCLPYKERLIKYKHIRREPWLTASLKNSIDRNKKLYVKMLRHECSLEKYKTYNHKLHKFIRHAKSKFYSDMCYEYRCQTKKLWGLINEISGKKEINLG